MYRIKVTAPITNWNIDQGYFTCCYRCKMTSEDSVSTWIGFISDTHPEAYKIKTFETYKQAENKLKFLKEKNNQNGYMWNWKLEIEEIK